MNQRKHELQKNELADFLGKEADVAWQHLPKVIIGVLAAAVVGVVIYYATTRQEDPAVAEGWQQYYAAYGEPDQALYLTQLLEKNKNKNIATLWSKQALADANFSKATGNDFITRPEEAKKAAIEAEKGYREVVDDAATNEVLKSKALFGLARALEEQQKFDEAKEKFALVVQKEKESPLGKLAAAAGKRLEDPKQIEFLTWFAKQDLRPTTSLMNDLQDRPNINFPGKQGSGSSGTGTGLKGIGVGDDGIEMPAGGENPLGIRGVTEGSTPAKEATATEPAATEGEKPAAEPAKTEPAATEPAKEAAAETPAAPKTDAVPEAAKTAEPPAAK